MADDRRSLLLAEAASRGYFGRAVVAASYRRYRVPGAVEEVGRAVLRGALANPPVGARSDIQASAP
jgi:hypothetical protein